MGGPQYMAVVRLCLARVHDCRMDEASVAVDTNVTLSFCSWVTVRVTVSSIVRFC